MANKDIREIEDTLAGFTADSQNKQRAFDTSEDGSMFYKDSTGKIRTYYAGEIKDGETVTYGKGASKGANKVNASDGTGGWYETAMTHYPQTEFELEHFHLHKQTGSTGRSSDVYPDMVSVTRGYHPAGAVDETTGTDIIAGAISLSINHTDGDTPENNFSGKYQLTTLVDPFGKLQITDDFGTLANLQGATPIVGADFATKGYVDGISTDIGSVTVANYSELQSALLGDKPIILLTTKIQIPCVGAPTPPQLIVDLCDKTIIGDLEIVDATETDSMVFRASVGETRRIYQRGTLEINISSEAQPWSRDCIFVDLVGYNEYSSLIWRVDQVVQVRGIIRISGGNISTNNYVANSAGAQTDAPTYNDFIVPNGSRVGATPEKTVVITEQTIQPARFQHLLDSGAVHFNFGYDAVTLTSAEYFFGGFDYVFGSTAKIDKTHSQLYNVFDLVNVTFNNLKSNGYYPASLTFEVPVRFTGTFHQKNDLGIDGGLGWAGRPTRFKAGAVSDGATIKGAYSYITHISGTELICDSGHIYYETKDSGTVLTAINGGMFTQAWWLNDDIAGALALKADLVGGKVPAEQLPSYVDDVVEVANYASLPATGETGKIYVTIDTNKVYRWSGSAYVEIQSGNFLKLDQTTPQVVFGGRPIVEGFTFDTTPSTSDESEGVVRWNATYKCLEIVMANGVVQQVGEEMYAPLVKNMTGQTITEGSVVYANGRNGQYQTIALAKSDSATTSNILGIATENIIDGAIGRITTFGYVRGIKTNYAGWNEGDFLWVSKTTAGALTNAEPSAPHHSDIVGQVGVSSAAPNGTILVQIKRHTTFDKLSDVNDTALTTDGQIAVWNQTAGYHDFTKNINDYAVYHGVFYDPTTGYEATMSYSTRALSFSAPTTIWVKGKKFTVASGVFHTIPDTSGKWYVSMDSTGTISSSTTQWDSTNVSPIAIVLHKVGGLSKVWEERHKYNRNSQDHVAMHNSIGTILRTAPSVTSIVLNGSTDADNSYALSSVAIQDEEITVTSRTKTDVGTIPVLYVDAGGIPDLDVTNAQGYSVGTTYIKKQVSISGGGVAELTPAAQGTYVNAYLFGATFIDNTYTYFVAMGYQQWDKSSASDTSALSNAQNAQVKDDCPIFANLSLQEVVPFYKITYFVKSTLATTGKVNVASVQAIAGGRQSLISGTVAGSIAASNVTFSPTGNIAATDVQSAIAELDTEKQTTSALLTAWAAIASAADKLWYTTGANAFASIQFLSWARTFLSGADIASARNSIEASSYYGTSMIGFGSISANDALQYKELLTWTFTGANQYVTGRVVFGCRGNYDGLYEVELNCFFNGSTFTVVNGTMYYRKAIADGGTVILVANNANKTIKLYHKRGFDYSEPFYSLLINKYNAGVAFTTSNANFGTSAPTGDSVVTMSLASAIKVATSDLDNNFAVAQRSQATAAQIIALGAKALLNKEAGDSLYATIGSTSKRTISVSFGDAYTTDIDTAFFRGGSDVQPKKYTVPFAGSISFASMDWEVAPASAYKIRYKKNGGAWTDFNATTLSAAGVYQAPSPAITFSAGDYFEFGCNQSGTSTVLLVTFLES